VRYRRVTDERDLAAALREPGAAILAGGTDLLVKIRAGFVRPELLVDIDPVATLRGIRRTASAVEIGAGVPESDVLASPIVRKDLPLLATALRALGSVQIRNRGTLGGNLVNASPAADSAIPLLLYNAELDLVGPGGERTLPVELFLLGPGTTALAPGEFIRTIRVPVPTAVARGFYHKVGRRRALTIAIASLGARIRLEDARIAEARFAAGSVAPTPIRLRTVEDALRGSTLSDETIANAGRLASASVSPISDVRAPAAYRAQVIGELVSAALQSSAAPSG